MQSPETFTETQDWERQLRPGVRLLRVHNTLWRVIRPGGEVLGYLEQFPSPGGHRFRAKRLVPRQSRFVIVGEFWSADDAVESLRSS